MLDAFIYLLYSKLSWHNQLVPTYNYHVFISVICHTYLMFWAGIYRHDKEHIGASNLGPYNIYVQVLHILHIASSYIAIKSS